jgi:spermidine synthase
MVSKLFHLKTVLSAWAFASLTDLMLEDITPLVGSFSKMGGVLSAFSLFILLISELGWPGFSGVLLDMILFGLSLYGSRLGVQTAILYIRSAKGALYDPKLVAIVPMMMTLLPIGLVARSSLAETRIAVPMSLAKLTGLALAYWTQFKHPEVLYGMAILARIIVERKFPTKRNFIIFFAGMSIILGISHVLLDSPFYTHSLSKDSFPVIHPRHPENQIFSSTKSVTGQVIVGELKPVSNNPKYSTTMRYLRVDHSLIGGVWVDTKTNKVISTIYPVFILQEAARLISPAPRSKEVIVLGLGTGAVVEGLVKNGYSTSILELDPEVYFAAKDYFELPETKEVFLEDAETWANNYKAGVNSQKYGIVIHDFFTGGGVPAKLFSIEFWTNLQANILANDGVLVINFYHKFNSFATKAIMKTLLSVFDTCELLHDTVHPKFLDPTVTADENTNMVAFCRNRGYKIDFRNDQKYGNNMFRKYIFNTLEQRKWNLDHIKKDNNTRYILTDTYNPMSKWDIKEAENHWKLMNMVLPPEAWELF